MRRKIVSGVAASALVALTLVTAQGAEAGPNGCANRNNNTHAKLLECVTVDGVREHQAAFQAIADANGGTRASGTPGYEESVDYVVERMTAAGYNVTIDTFPFVFVPAPTLTQLTPTPASHGTAAIDRVGIGRRDGRRDPDRHQPRHRRGRTPVDATARTRKPPSAPRSSPTRPA